MPFKSKRQQRWMFAAEARGEVPRGTAERWARHTKSIKSLPEKKKSEGSEKSAGPIADLLRRLTFRGKGEEFGRPREQSEAEKDKALRKAKLDKPEEEADGEAVKKAYFDGMFDAFERAGIDPEPLLERAGLI